MNLFAILSGLLASGQMAFERHDIDDFPGGYQVAVADVNCDGRPDVIALSTQADRVDWYQNPNWQRRSVARTARNIDLAAHDLDGDGLYDPLDAGDTRFRTDTIDEGIAVEGAVAADINLDGRLDLVAIGGRTNDLAWYENRR